MPFFIAVLFVLFCLLTVTIALKLLCKVSKITVIASLSVRLASLYLLIVKKKSFSILNSSDILISVSLTP